MSRRNRPRFYARKRSVRKWLRVAAKAIHVALGAPGNQWFTLKAPRGL